MFNIHNQPVRPPTPGAYQSDDFEQKLLTDFTGGMNITDLAETLPDNQFTNMSDLFLTRKGQLKTRPPYRPFTFSATVEDSALSDGTYIPTKIVGYKIIPAVVSGWSYNGEIHVVALLDSNSQYSVWAYKPPTAWLTATVYAALDVVKNNGYIYRCKAGQGHTSGDTDDEPGVGATQATYWEAWNGWIQLWTSATATDVRIIPYQLNGAVDIFIYPDNDGPERYAFKASALSDMGLTAPTVGNFTTVLTEGDNSAGFVRATAETVYYKYAFFYDEVNSTTRFGESASTAITTTSSEVLSVTTANGQISFAFTDVSVPVGVSKINVYRAPLGEVGGPYLIVGSSTATTAPDAAGAGVFPAFVDTISWGEEGIQDLVPGTNPSLSGSVLTILRPSLVGTSIIGFDATITGKAIRSKEGNPDIWNPLAFDYLEGSGQGALAFNRKVYVFTDKGCWQKETADSPAFGISLVGCSDGRSIQDIGNGIVWMGADSIYFADFVQQYGSKGDFPMDIGHEIFDDVQYQDLTEPISSTFFQRRYYLTFIQSNDLSRKTYVYDADFKSWQRHSVAHEAFAAGKDTLYSAGMENYLATSYWYVYEHDYSASVAIGTWSLYAGVDRHDYRYLDLTSEPTTPVYAGSKDITITLTREKVRLGGVFQRYFISSAIIYAKADTIDANVIFTNEDGDTVTLNFAQAAAAGTEFPAVYDDPGTVYAATAAYTVKAATDALRGYNAITVAGMRRHKKAKRQLKDLSFDITLQVAVSRDFRLSLLGFRYKPLPPQI